MEHILRRHRVPGLAGLDFEELHYFLANLQAHCLCFLRIPIVLLWLTCLVLLPVVSKMLCNLSLHAWIVVSHQQTWSVYDMVRLAYLQVMGCTLWILLSETFCSLPFHSCDILSFMVVPLIAIVLVPCGYLAVRAIVIVIAGSPPLASVSVSSIILW
jgi:hypothetical protein